MHLNHLHAYNVEIREWILSVIAKSHQLAKGELVLRPCPLCGGNALVPFADNGALCYVRCSSCALVFQNPAPPAHKVNEGFEGNDPLLKTYFEIVSRFKGDIPPKPDPTTHSKLKDIYACKPSGRLLDIGCSMGDFLHLSKHFYNVEGLEINPVTAGIAARSFTVYNDYLSNVHLSPVYDVVTMHQILYGVPNPVELLIDIRSILKDDGILYINTPNADSYATRLFGGQCCDFYGYSSLNVFSPTTIRELAKNAGFRIKFLRTEWLDIYTPDIREFYDSQSTFIHKRNCHRPGYEDHIAAEDDLHRRLYPDLGDGGNYLLAILQKDQ